MLSILIPVFNQNICHLVNDIHQQCRQAGIPFEIICFDDASDERCKVENRKISSLFHVSYIEIRENKGVSIIRNMLAKNARYEKLLYLDGDSKVHSKKFIRNYLKNLDSSSMICGGRKYNNRPPRANSKRLHWKYGSQRESLPAIQRNKHPYRYFHSNNFIAERSILMKHGFQTDLQYYGYDDLSFAHKLKLAGISIKHIDNPILHRGLEKTPQFLKKIKDSTKNLAKLYREDKIEDTRLINTYERVQKFALQDLFEKIYEIMETKIEAYLFNANPKLWALDLYKLYHFSKNQKSYDQRIKYR